MRVVLAVLAVAALAGCLQPAPAPTAALVAPPPELPSWSDSIDQYVYAGSAPGCLQGVCSGGSGPIEVYEAPENASVRAFRLDLGALQNYDQPVIWKVSCRDGNDEGPCVRALAQGQDKLPLHVERAGLNLTGGAKLLVTITEGRTVAPFVDSFAAILHGSSHATGTVDLQEAPEQPDAPGGNETAEPAAR